MNRGAVRSLGLVFLFTLLLLPGTVTPNGMVISINSGDAGEDPGEPRFSPLNPAFLKYLERGSATAETAGKSATTRTFSPSPFKLEPHKPGQAVLTGPLAATALSSRYDLRDPNGDGNTSDSLLTPVRKQGSCEASWAFAPYGALESNVLMTLGVAENYSENNLKHLHGFDFGPCQGGAFDMAAAYLARHSGPISEADDPYDVDSKSACTTCSPVRYIDNGIYLPSRGDVTDNLFLKQAIVDHGAIATSMYYQESSYDAETRTYYYNDPDNSYDDVNLGVVLVGWDDTKEVVDAPGPGAFIVRNDKGSSWGEKGYFHVSYHDQALGFQGSLAFDEKPDSALEFDRIYSYDPLGLTDGFGYSSEAGTYGWGANWFTPETEGDIVAVSFFSTGPNLHYEIYVYGDHSDYYATYSDLLATKSGTIPNAGWYTIPLDTPVPIFPEDDFGIAIRFAFDTPEGYPVPLESPIRGYSSGASAEGTHSGRSSDGITWEQLGNSRRDSNVCIKALVKSAFRTGAVKVRLLPEGAVDEGALWRVDGGDWQTSGTMLTGLAPGEHTISFQNIHLWQAPEPTQVTLDPGQVVKMDVTYTQKPPVVVTVEATDVEASEIGPDPASFRVHRTGSTELPLGVFLKFSGTAYRDLDYDVSYPSNGGLYTMPEGQSDITVTITPRDDEQQENAETATVTVQSDYYYHHYTVGSPSSASATITDNDRPIFSIEPLVTELVEQNRKIRCFKITREVELGRKSTALLSTSGTAVAGVDYVALPKKAVFDPNVSTKYIQVEFLEGSDLTGDRTLVLEIRPRTQDYLINPPGSATITLRDDDAPVSVIANTSEVSEGGHDPGVFTITRPGPLERPLTVAFSLTGTAEMGKDYDAVTRQVTIPAGEGIASVAISPINDAGYQGRRTVILNLLQGKDYTIGSPATAQLDIVDNDSPPVVNLVATDVDMSEPGATRNNGQLSVTRTGPVALPLTVRYEVAGTATAGTDYRALSGSVTLGAGERTGAIPIFPLHDTEHEGNETIVVTLTPDSLYQIGARGSLTVRIRDNDS